MIQLLKLNIIRMEWNIRVLNCVQTTLSNTIIFLLHYIAPSETYFFNYRRKALMREIESPGVDTPHPTPTRNH